MYDDNYYEENQEEIFDAAVDTALNQMNESKEDNLLLSVGIKKEWLLKSIKSLIDEYASEQIKSAKQEAINTMRLELIDKKFNNILEEELRKSIKEKTDKIMIDFMNRKIRISKGYWGDSYEEIPIKEYIENKVDKWIQEDSNKSLQKATDNLIDYHIKNTVENFGRDLKNDINKKINDMFNQTTRNTLSESMFNILTQSESYRNLKNSLNNLLENK